MKGNVLPAVKPSDEVHGAQKGDPRLMAHTVCFPERTKAEPQTQTISPLQWGEGGGLLAESRSHL